MKNALKARNKRIKKRKELFPQDTVLSLVVVTQNDEDIIEEKLKLVNKKLAEFNTNYEILIVDNNSQDKTAENIRKMHKLIPYLRVLILSKEYETEIALTAGLDNCIGDYVILFDLYTDPPEIILTLAEKLLEGYDIIIGKCKHEIVRRGFFPKLFLGLVEKISTQGFSYRTNYLTALNRKAINSIIQTRRKSRNFSYINYLIGFKKCVVEYKPLKKFRQRLEKENFLNLFLRVTDIIISNSFRPIRFLSFLGMFASVLFLVYVVVVAIIYFFFNKSIAPQGWISISFVVGAMFFLLFSLLTLIAEYIIRIMNETRNEPFYFVADELDKSIILKTKNRLNVV